MIRMRFVRVWVVWAVAYAALVAVGPQGLIPNPVWPVISQHVLQTRAWLGDDIDLWNENGTFDRTQTISPRLDVTPYFQHRVINDPRESTLMANLAVTFRDPDRGLVSIQEAWTGSDDLLMSHDVACWVGFPPGPSFLLLPLFAIFRGLLATQLLSAILGGLAVATMDRFLADWIQAMAGDGPHLPANLVAGLAGAGTLWLWIVPDGGTFLFAQVVGTTALSLALFAAWSKHNWLAGLAYGIAITSRPAMLFALPLLLACAILHRDSAEPDEDGGKVGRSRFRELMHSAPLFVGPLIFGALALAFNVLRFGSLQDFGYRFMIVPPVLRERLLEFGQVSFAYLIRNIQFVGLQPPMFVRDSLGAPTFPFLVSDPQGMGLFFVTPAFAALVLAFRITGRSRRLLLATTWAALTLTCLPGLMYYNTGWVQWGGRFLMDAWPMWLLLAIIGLHRMPPRLAWGLIVLSIVSNSWCALLVAIRSWPGCCF